MLPAVTAMASVTTTEISVVEKILVDYICQDCETDHGTKETGYLCNNNNEYNKISAYEQTQPTDEPRFMSSVRNWEKRMGFITPIKWTNAISIILFHVIATSCLAYTCVFYSHMFKWQTVLFGCITGQLAGFGVTAGAHRLWSHRSYKAKWPLKIILLLCYSLAGQNNIYNWVRDHRVHHKHSETSADPHDANRGFFFSHVGWLMMKKHPDVIREGAKIDMTDISNDPLLRFYIRHFNLFKLLCCFVIPTAIPMVCWDESCYMAILSQPMIRYMLTLNFTWSVNSFAHLWGNKPYDRYIMPSENWGVSLVAMGEGWHNYHHTFPMDYKAAELPYSINVTTLLIDLFANIGWAYDRKSTSESLIRAVVKNRGSKHL